MILPYGVYLHYTRPRQDKGEKALGRLKSIYRMNIGLVLPKAATFTAMRAYNLYSRMRMRV